MRVFVIGTGRTGSTTFSHACAHITNHGSGHETRWGVLPPERLRFPADHIEVDNRLSWHLGELAIAYPNAFWVHLTRDQDAVIDSFLKRWRWDPPHRYRRFPVWLRPLAGKLEAPLVSPWMAETYAYGILGRGRTPWAEEDRRSVVQAFVDTVRSNITEFLAGREHLVVDIDDVEAAFSLFWSRIGAEGDLAAALEEFNRRHNASS